MKEQSIKKNMMFQGIYQFLILGIPLVISPYLTRTLGAKSLGIYTYTNSIAYYFVILANLGISRHGQRTIAASSHDEIKLRKKFWSLYFVHSFFSVGALILYFLFILFIVEENKLVFMIQGLYVLSALFDITWLFYGIENFKSVVTRNIIVKLTELVCIFTFIKKEDDLLLYTFIMVGSTLFGQIIMVSRMFKIKPIQINWFDCKEHIKPLLILSISVIAVSLYTVFDKTLLGVMLNMYSVSYYEYANKIVSVPKALLGVITTVLFPRVCKLAEKKNNEKLKEFFDVSFFFTGMIGIGFTAIIIGISNTFSILYFGKNFEKTGDVMIAMSAVIVIVSLGDLIRTQLMISKKRDSQFILCVVINAIVNIILTVSLIKVIGIYGAVIGSVAAELCGLIMETWFCRKDINLKNTYFELMPFLLIGIVTTSLILLVKKCTTTSIYSLILQCFVGFFIYCILSTIYISRFKKPYFDIICKFIKRR